MSDTTEPDVEAAIASALAPHRQEHVPETGASRCAHGDWGGPFTIYAGAGSFAQHLATIVLHTLEECASVRNARTVDGTAPLRPALPGPGVHTGKGGWLPLGPPRWEDQPLDWVKDAVDELPDTLPGSSAASPAGREREVRHDHDEPIIGCRCAEKYGTRAMTEEGWDSIRVILGDLAGPSSGSSAEPARND